MNLIFISGKPQEGGTKGWNLNLVCSVRVVHKQCDAFLALLFGAPLWFSDRGRIKDRRMTRMNLPFVPSFSPPVLFRSRLRHPRVRRIRNNKFLLSRKGINSVACGPVACAVLLYPHQCLHLVAKQSPKRVLFERQWMVTLLGSMGEIYTQLVSAV